MKAIPARSLANHRRWIAVENLLAAFLCGPRNCYVLDFEVGKEKENRIRFPLEEFFSHIFHRAPRSPWTKESRVMVEVSQRLFMFLGRRQLHYGNKWIEINWRNIEAVIFSFVPITNLRLQRHLNSFSFPGEEKTANIFKVIVKDSQQFLFYLLFIFFNFISIPLWFNLLIYYFRLQSVFLQFLSFKIKIL